MDRKFILIAYDEKTLRENKFNSIYRKLCALWAQEKITIINSPSDWWAKMTNNLNLETKVALPCMTGQPLPIALKYKLQSDSTPANGPFTKER